MKDLKKNTQYEIIFLCYLSATLELLCVFSSRTNVTSESPTLSNLNTIGCSKYILIGCLLIFFAFTFTEISRLKLKMFPVLFKETLAVVCILMDCLLIFSNPVLLYGNFAITVPVIKFFSFFFKVISVCVLKSFD